MLIIAHSVAIGAREITRGSQTFFGVPRVTDLLLALVAALLAIMLARYYRESRWGLFARAARDDTNAATALGINARATRFNAWCVSGVLATIAGALYGHMLGAFSPASFYLSLVFAQVVMMIVGGIASVGGAVTGVIAVTLLQDTVRQIEGGATVFGIALPEVFGVTTVALGLAILLVIWLRPHGLVGRFELGPGADAVSLPVFSKLKSSVLTVSSPPRAGELTLQADRLSKSFAGVEAVRNVSFDVPGGRVTGLIGPNGAGKSTLVNLLTHAYRPDSGASLIGNVDLARLPPHKVPCHGIARRFQNLRLFHGLTAYENVYVAALAAGNSKREANTITLRELNSLDLSQEAGYRADSLPYGARKRLEIARALASNPQILLLDEPAAGMNPAETEDLAGRLSDICSSRGIGILLIDHDLRFVNRLSQWIVVMHRGEIIAQGTPEAVRENPVVIEAYIGRGRSAQTANVSNDTSDLNT